MLGNIVLGSFIYGNSGTVYSFADIEADLSQSISRLRLRTKGVISIFPSAPRLVELDYFLIVNRLDYFPGVKVGSYAEFDEWGTTITVSTGIGSYAEWIANELYFTSYIPIGLWSSADFSIIQLNRNLLKWSNIGSLDFTIRKDNIAGERPTDWSSWIYDIRKFRGKVIVYGKNGISFLNPHGVHYGLETIMRRGLKGKRAVCGNDLIQYFIDNIGQLWELSENFKKLDYSRFLSEMTNPVMSYDAVNDVIYICDGTYGYIYSIGDQSFGVGPANISGIDYQDETLYIIAPSAISLPKFDLCTDIYDFGTRKNKTITSLEVGTDLEAALEASVDYRIINTSNFNSIGWYPVNREGIAYIPCFGQDFKFRLRSNVTQEFDIDYLKINGIIHDFSHLDYLGRNMVV